MKKTIEFSAKLNHAEFDAQISRLQQRLKQSQTDVGAKVLSAEVQQKMSKAGISTSTSPQQAEQQQKSSLREMDRFLKEQYNQAAKLNRAIDDRAKALEKLRKIEKESLNDEKKRLEVAQKIKDIEGQKQGLERQHQQQLGVLNQSLNQRQTLASGIQSPEGLERLKRAYATGGIGGAGRAGYRMMGGAMGLGLGAAGMIGTGIQMADPLIRSMAAENRNYTYAQGSAISGMSHTNDVYQNRMSSQMFFAPERQRALDTALEKMQKTQFADKYTLGVGGLLGKTAAGAGAGALVGGVGGLGVGALPGAVIGGAVGLGKGAYDIASDERSRYAFMANMGSEEAQKKLQALQISEMVSDFNGLIEAEKNKNPVKKAAEERFQQTRQRNLEVQRSMGLSNAGFYGEAGEAGQSGLLGRGFQAGYTEEETLGAAQGIGAAGGSTRSSRFNNVLANQMSRRMDMTNSSQLIGGLSRQLGGNVETEAATIKVMSEAMKLGLDKSEFAAEQRKFAEMTVGAIQAAGVSSVQGAGEAAAGFAAFNAGNTMADLNAMGGAQRAFDQATSQTGNPRGAIFASKIMNDPQLKGLSFDTQKVLSETPESQITSDNPAVQQAALESNMSAEEVVKKIKGIKGDSVIIRSGVENQRKALSAKYEKLRQEGKSETDINEILQKDPAFNKMLVGIGTEDSIQQSLSNQEKRAFGMKVIKGQVGSEELEDEVRKKALAGGSTGRVEDTALEAVARQQQIVNGNFLQMKDALELAAIGAKNMTERALEMHMRFAELMSKGDEVTAEKMREIALPKVPNAVKSK